MYIINSEAFGRFEKITLLNERSGNGFSIVPEMGGTILELWLDGHQVIDGCKDSEELENNQAYKSSILFPFPNRLKDGQYDWNGQEYQFPINDTGTNNALHGTSRDVSMDVLKKEATVAEALIVLSYFDEGTHEGYPFPFLFDLTIKISETAGFEMKMKFTNESNERIPVGIGWHPYFTINEKIDHAKLQLPDCKMIEIDERMLPTGALIDYNYFEKSRVISKAVLDNGFKLADVRGVQEVLLSSDDFGLKYWQETGPEKFNYLQVYTPDSRTSIAIEPMTCNIDALNNGDGLIQLAPEAFVEASCGLKVY